MADGVLSGYTPELEFTGTGGAGALAATLPELQLSCTGAGIISGTLPNLAFTGTAPIWVSMDAQLPELRFEGSFGSEGLLRGTIPSLAFSGSSGWEMDSRRLPELQFSGDMIRMNTGSVSGTLPQLLSSMVSGGQFGAENKLPPLSFSGNLVQDMIGTISGQLPGLKAVTSLTDPQIISCSIPNGQLPALGFSGNVSQDYYGSISGYMPMLNMSMVGYAYASATITVKLPPLAGSMEMIGNPYFDISGYLPDIGGCFSGGMNTAEDTTATGEDIIRHRRWS